MGILDRFKSKPKPAAPVVIQKRNYSAAQNIARYMDMYASRGSADYELNIALAEVRAKTRFLARNSGAMKRYIHLMKTNIVGPNGFRFQSRVKKQDGSLDKTLNEKVEADWDNWCKNPTVDGRLSMTRLQHQMVGVWCRDGEVLWEIVYNSRYADGVSINPIEADLLDETLNTVNQSSGNRIKMGVEIDEYGRPVAYHLLTSHPGDIAWAPQANDKRHRRVPADSIIHVFDPERPGQTRGEPPAAAAVNSIKMVDGYREAETFGRRLRSALMGFFTRTLPKPEGVGALADTVSSDGEMLEMSMEPGMLKQLPDGMDFKEFSPGGSQTDFKDFEGQVKKDIAQGLNISNMSHGMETEGVSYSAGRTIVIEDRDYYKVMQVFFIQMAMQRVFEKWLNRRVLQQSSAIMPSRVPAILGNYIFRPRGWDWVDPSKDVKANTEALRTKQTSLARVAADRGIDRDELLAEIAEDKQAAEAAGLTLDYTDGKNVAKVNAKDAKNVTPQP